MAIAVQPFEGTYELDREPLLVQFAVNHVGSRPSAPRSRTSTHGSPRTTGDIALDGHARVESISIVDPRVPRARRPGRGLLRGGHPSTDHVPLDERRARRRPSATVSGELAIRGVSRPVTASGTYAPPTADPFGAVRAALELRATIDRRSWDLDWQLPLPDGSDALGWEVEITAHLELVKEGLMRLLAISGSLRRGSYNTALLDAAAAECPTGVEFVVWRGLADIPAYDEDLDIAPAPAAGRCASPRSHEQTPC